MSFFWNGYNLRDFLFKSFDSKTFPGFLGICVALFSAGILYEGMYFLKKDLLQKFLETSASKRLRKTQVAGSDKSIGGDATDGSQADDNGAGDLEEVGEVLNPRNSLLVDNDTETENETVRISRVVRNSEYLYLFTSSVIHACFACVGYTLMNAVMTFNVGILVAVCLGIGVGYFFFGHSCSKESDISGDIDDFQIGKVDAGFETDVFSNAATLTTKTDFNDEGSKATSPSPSRGSRSRPSSSQSQLGQGQQNHIFPSASRQIPIKKENGTTTPGPHVIVVGAQVHNYLEQST